MGLEDFGGMMDKKPDISSVMGDMPDIPDITGEPKKPDYELSKEYGDHRDSGEFNALADHELPSLDVGSITIRCGAILDGIIVTYSDGSTVQHGGGGGSANRISLNGDSIKAVTGQSGVNFCGRSVISQLRIETASGKKYGPFGSSGGGKSFEIRKDGKKIVGFFGSVNGGYISSLGAYLLR